MSPEDRATTIGNMQNIGNDRMCISRDMLGDRQTYIHAQTHTDTVITILCSPVERGVLKDGIALRQPVTPY